MISGLARFQIPADVAVVLFLVGRGHQHLDVTADDLVGVIAEQLRCRRAERGHDAGFVDDDHRLRDRIEDRAQMRLAADELGFGPLQFGDVAVHLEYGRNLSVFGRLRDPEAGDRDEGAIFPLLFNFALPASAFAHLLDDRVARQRIAGLQKLVNNRSERFLAAPTVKALASRGPVQDLPLLVMDDDVCQVQHLGHVGKIDPSSRFGPVLGRFQDRLPACVNWARQPAAPAWAAHRPRLRRGRRYRAARSVYAGRSCDVQSRE